MQLRWSKYSQSNQKIFTVYKEGGDQLGEYLARNLRCGKSMRWQLWHSYIVSVCC